VVNGVARTLIVAAADHLHRLAVLIQMAWREIKKKPLVI
jgi:hypothetical protein